jgi:hypothetical protein
MRLLGDLEAQRSEDSLGPQLMLHSLRALSLVPPIGEDLPVEHVPKLHPQWFELHLAVAELIRL